MLYRGFVAADRVLRRATTIAGVGLLVLAVGLAVLASTLAAGEVEAAAAPVPVNPGAREGLDARAHNSPSVARNPTDPANIVVANRVDTPQYSCALHVSLDGGAAWSETPIPFPAGEELPERCFAPDPTFGADGTLYLAFVTLKGAGNSPNAVWVAASTDGGRTVGAPVRALGPLAFQVRLVADAERAGILNLSWLQADSVALVSFPNPANPINLMRSTDGGRTWSPPVRVSGESRQRVVAPVPAAGREGELYVLYLELGDDRLDYHGAHGWRGGDPYQGTWSLVLARSTDGGGTWAESVVDDAVVPTQRVMIFLPPAPSLAVDAERGTVHVAFHDGRRGDADVLLWTSRDRGRSFGAPRRIDDAPGTSGTTQYLPRVAVAPDGRVDVAYYDRRRDALDVMNEVSFQSSFDGGRTFTARRTLSDRAFDSRVGFGGSRGMPDLGSRLGLLAGAERSLAFWTDTRRGTPRVVRQDVAYAAVEISSPSSARGTLRVAAGGAGVLGLVLVAFAFLRGGRRARMTDEPGA